ncbi:TRAFAC clade GTPase domain-containing protein [Ideonella sp.]|uniref:TRAFAC clade GTPase domain-containing protein n=1 Tax=Ideonella sp. TaxID=1929293 RepID=UPI003BB50064
MIDNLQAQLKTCSNPDCRIAQDGRCVEGFLEPAVCSHYGKALVIVDGKALDTPKLSVRPGIKLPGADALPNAAAQALLRERPCTVIALIGPHESGKTSLIGGIYDLLQYDKVGNYAFAGSTTLHAFERACHDSRTASNREEAHMERTDRGQVTYFHLDLAEVNEQERITTLFANRDGEAYMDTHANPDLAADYPELSRCDTLTVLADGVKLLDDAERHQVLNDVCLTIRAFVEAGQTRSWQRVAVVLTKIDAVRKANNQATGERAVRHFARIVDDVRGEFSDRFAEIQPFQVSASPKGGDGERGEGMQDLLAYWMKVPYRLTHASRTSEQVHPLRAFGRLCPISVGGAND